MFSKQSPHADNLLALSAGAKGFQVISAREALRIHKTIKKRSPQTYGHVIGGASLVHVSAAGEMVPWKDLSVTLRNVGVAGVVKQINTTGLRPPSSNDVQLAA